MFYAAPRALSPHTPVVFVHHGVRRNADVYRDNWVGLASAFNVLVVAPSFGQSDFPGARSYNLGGVFGPENAPQPMEQWAFAAIEPLFSDLQARLGSHHSEYLVFGHSAGSQFVHRFLAHTPVNRVRAAVAANAGWYTMPQADVAWPYGLQGAVVSEEGLRQMLATPLLILLGEEDNDPQGPSLRRTPEALAQGPHRLARGKAFFAAGRAQAEQRGAPFGWRLATVPGADHDNNMMAAPALTYLLEQHARAAAALQGAPS